MGTGDCEVHLLPTAVPGVLCLARRRLIGGGGKGTPKVGDSRRGLRGSQQLGAFKADGGLLEGGHLAILGAVFGVDEAVDHTGFGGGEVFLGEDFSGLADGFDLAGLEHGGETAEGGGF